MSLMNPGLYGNAPARQAASLKTTLAWYATHVWQALEYVGRRRAAGELSRLAARLERSGHASAAQFRKLAEDCATR